MIYDKPEVSPSGRYTIAQVAEILEVSRQSVYRYIKRLKIYPVYRKADRVSTLKGSDIIRIWADRY